WLITSFPLPRCCPSRSFSLCIASDTSGGSQRCVDSVDFCRPAQVTNCHGHAIHLLPPFTFAVPACGSGGESGDGRYNYQHWQSPGHFSVRLIVSG
ncbi:unnamed protein product, partial [Closterium sp. NIES-53]